MTTSNPLRLPHSARKALLTGPTISLVLPMPSIGMTHTIPSLPRRMLFAFSHLAAAQLTVADGVNTSATPSTPSSSSSSSSSSTTPATPPTQQPSRTITLPPNSCTPAALELLIQWLKQSCCQHPASSSSPPHTATATQPLLPTVVGDNWRQLLRVYAAARALRVPVAEAELRARIEARLRDAPLSLAEFADAVDTLGFDESSDEEEGGSRLVKEVVRRTAGFARRGVVDAGAAEEMRGWLGSKWPGLVGKWEACDRVAVGGRRLDVRWVEGMKQRLEDKARKREEEEVREEEAERKKREELGAKVRDFEERLRRQRRLAGLQCR